MEVRLAEGTDVVSIRDSKQTQAGDGSEQPTIDLTPVQFSAFLAMVARGRQSTEDQPVSFRETNDGCYVLSSSSGISLTYTQQEWEAFVTGVLEGDFGPVPTAIS